MVISRFRFKEKKPSYNIIPLNQHHVKIMDFLMENMDEVVQSESFSRLYQSETITKEIMVYKAKRARLK